VFRIVTDHPLPGTRPDSVNVTEYRIGIALNVTGTTRGLPFTSMK